MKIPIRLLTLALIAIPAVPALAVANAGSTTPTAPTTVARYTFDDGASTAGKVVDTSGRGLPLTVRSADSGAVRFVAGKTGRYVAFPAPCAKSATNCGRVLLEAANDADLNPGTGTFSWGASINVTKAQIVGSSNIMQKGVSNTESQWKMQIGATHGKAQCVVVGHGSAQAYLVRSSVSIADGVWHRVLCQRVGAVLTVLVDGASSGRVAIPATLSIANTRPLRVGGPNFNTTSDMYHGYLDDVYAVRG
jgi:hypothetical protein